MRKQTWPEILAQIGGVFSCVDANAAPKTWGPKQEQNKRKKAKVLPKIRTRNNGKIYIYTYKRNIYGMFIEGC